MCDQSLSAKPEKQTSSEDIQFSPSPISLGFTGPTYAVSAKLSSRTTTKAFITSGVSLEFTDKICLNDVSQSQMKNMTFPATIQIGRLKTGPYTDTGGGIDFKNLYFNFFDLVLDTQIVYMFDPTLICNQTIPQTYNIDNKPFQAKVVKISFDQSKYFSTNTDDDTNINQFQNDLIGLFADAQSNFVEFFNVIVVGLLNQTGFGRKVESSLDAIYCDEKKENVINTYILFEDKIKRLERIGISFREFI